MSHDNSFAAPTPLTTVRRNAKRGANDMDTIDKSSAQHYQWGEGCDGWRLAEAAMLSVIEERMPPGASEVRHVHAKATQFFYVLRGTLTIEVEGRTHVLGMRQGIQIAAGQAHQVLNRTAADAEFLVVSSPPSRDDRALAEPGV
jgi:quercetin dioxygenase-like cupin family protein